MTPSSEPAARPEVRLVAGRLSDAELSAVVVALSAVNAASRAEARERTLAAGIDGSAGECSGWTDAVHRLPGTHDQRGLAGPSAWQFSHR